MIQKAPEGKADLEGLVRGRARCGLARDAGGCECALGTEDGGLGSMKGYREAFSVAREAEERRLSQSLGCGHRGVMKI